MTSAPVSTQADPKTDIVSPLKFTEQEIQFYEDEGYLYLPRVVDLSTAAALREETLEVLEQAGLSRATMRKAAGAADALRQNSQYLAGSLIDRLVNSANMRDIACQLLGGPSTTYFPFTAVKAGGGGGSFHFHQDNQYTRHDGPSNNIWIALNPMTPDNGCLCMVPRTHLSGTLDPTPDASGKMMPMTSVPPRYLPVRMNPGDAIAFTRLTVHGSGPNHTDDARVAYALQFHRDDTRWLDRATHEWKLLKDQPRFKTIPVSEITRMNK